MVQDRVKTGIPGLDPLIGGGFVRGSVNMVSGGAGAGKTIFGLQYLWNGLTRFNEPGIYVSTEERPEDLRKDALMFGWDFGKYEKAGAFAFLYHPPYQGKAFSSSLKQAIQEIGAKRIVVDSTSVFGVALDDPYESRKLNFELSQLLKSFGVTGVSISEVSGEGPIDVSSGAVTLSRDGVEEFVADSVILLNYGGLGGASDRMMRIIKMRRTDHKKGLFPFNIRKSGIIISTKENAYG